MKVCINSKGFTLVELLAVMVILISISLVAVVGITSSLERSEKKECEHQKELVINAAKIYFSLQDQTRVTVGTLIDLGYIKDEEKIDIIKRSDEVSVGRNDYVLNVTCN